MIFGDRPPAALADYTGFLMNWVATRSRRHFMHALEESCGLHPRDFGVLSVVAANPGITQQALGESAGVDPSTMVATLDMLAKRGLAERRPHPADRRKRAVHVTPAGKRALRQGRRVAAAAAREVFEPLTPEEREQLHRLLLKLSGLTGDDSG